MSTQHTPGPWSVGSNHHAQTFVRACDFQVALLCDGKPPEIAANARLIAAAPELLVALTELLPEYKAFVADCGHDPSVGIDCSADFGRIEKARAAIAKATGAAP